MTKAIYRRVPVLIREAWDGQPEENPWGIRFSAILHMANDSHRFRTRERLEADGWKLEGNVFRKGGAEYLPLYEAKMVHQFDHRWASYRVEGGKTATAVVPLLDKQDPAFVVLPRYWVEAREVHRRTPVTSTPDPGRNPRPRRTADLPGVLEAPSSPQPSQMLCDGDAGGNADLSEVRPPGSQWTERPRSSMRAEDGDPRLQRPESARTREAGGPQAQRTGSQHTQDAGGSHTQDTGSHPSAASFAGPSRSLTRRVPANTTGSDVRSSTEAEVSDLAEDGGNQVGTRWLVGRRDITRSVEKRTTIADIIPFAAVGDQLLLMYPDTTARLAAVLLGALNSFRSISR